MAVVSELFSRQLSLAGKTKGGCEYLLNFPKEAYITTLKANQHTWDLRCGCILLAIVISSDRTLTCCLPYIYACCYTRESSPTSRQAECRCTHLFTSQEKQLITAVYNKF